MRRRCRLSVIGASRNFFEAAGVAGASDVQIEKQLAMIRVSGLTRTPRRGDYLTDGAERWAITSVSPLKGQAVTVAYELGLDEA